MVRAVSGRGVWRRIAVAILWLTASVAMAQPRIGVVSDSLHNFGKVVQGTDPSYIVRVVNRGAAVLTIREINPGCFCTSGTVDRKSLAPGDTARVTVTFHSATFNGPLRRSLDVITDDADQPHTYLVYTVTVISVLRAEPIYIYLGHLVLHEVNEGTTSLRNTTDKAIRITDLRCSNADVKLRVGKKEIAPGDTTLLTASLIPREMQYYKGDIDIGTDSDLQRKVRIYWAFSPISGKK